ELGESPAHLLTRSGRAALQETLALQVVEMLQLRILSQDLRQVLVDPLAQFALSCSLTRTREELPLRNWCQDVRIDLNDHVLIEEGEKRSVLDPDSRFRVLTLSIERNRDRI